MGPEFSHTYIGLDQEEWVMERYEYSGKVSTKSDGKNDEAQIYTLSAQSE